MYKHIKENITEEYINKHRTNDICPITGDYLIRVGHDEYVRDGCTYYEPEHHLGQIQYSRHPFQWNILSVEFCSLDVTYYEKYQVIDRYAHICTYEPVIFYVKLFKYLPVNTSPGYIKRLYKIAKQKEKARERRDKKNRYRVLLPLMIPIVAKSVATELVEVKPMEVPKGELYYFNYTYKINDNIPDIPIMDYMPKLVEDRQTYKKEQIDKWNDIINDMIKRGKY